MNEMLPNISKQNTTHQSVLVALGIIAIIASAFHFWPLEEMSFWKLVNLTNLSILLGVVIYVAFTYNNKDLKLSLLPPVSVWAYIAFHFLSIAYAETFSRPIIYSIKILLVFAGGYLFFMQAFQNKKMLAYVPRVIIAAVIISIGSAIYFQHVFRVSEGGFFGSRYKYGTYTGIMASFAVVYLLSGRRLRDYALAFIIILTFSLSVRSIGGALGVLVGLSVALFFSKDRYLRLSLLTGLLLVVFLAIAFNYSLRNDFKLIENDSHDLRQRYIEWQAEINMLEKYAISGSGGGSINDYRSNFYYLMPKLNTLQPFDQNGWLTVPAEIGVFGLLCFIWIFYDHVRPLLHSLSYISSEMRRINISLLAALSASCVCNVFSSVHYNGVLIAYVLMLALSKSISHKSEKG